MSQALYTLPLNRVIELRLCNEHYTRNDPSVLQRHGTIPEELCKIDEVQQRLAWLQGIMEITLVVCGNSMSKLEISGLSDILMQIFL